MVSKSLYLILIFTIAIVGFLVIRVGKNSSGSYDKAQVTIGDKDFSLDLANTIQKRQKGLGGRDLIEESGGMLFTFNDYGKRRIWMRGMEVPIDIVWVRGDKVVGFEKNVQPQPGVATINLNVYRSPEPVDKVVELKAGSIEKYQIGYNDTVKVDFQE